MTKELTKSTEILIILPCSMAILLASLIKSILVSFMHNGIIMLLFHVQ